MVIFQYAYKSSKELQQQQHSAINYPPFIDKTVHDYDTFCNRLTKYFRNWNLIFYYYFKLRLN